MTVDWRHRIIRVPLDEEEQRDALLRAVAEGWIFEAQEQGDGQTVDMVFRRARPQQPRIVWN
ncbi:MAG: hypothetical protein JWL76_976 [Thermoleophilia bacterium]|nr:hypothetical protein [Thermoleophilia bacterium]